MGRSKNTVDGGEGQYLLPCDHSFAYSTLTESMDQHGFTLEEVGSTRDGVLYMEVSFSCPRCQRPVTVELLESVTLSE